MLVRGQGAAPGSPRRRPRPRCPAARGPAADASSATPTSCAATSCSRTARSRSWRRSTGRRSPTCSTAAALDADEVAWLGLQLASALRYLHRRGLLHLDVKPSNIIASAGRAVLIDLSLAREPGRYRAGLGTWCYLSPEQARGDRLTAAADVWGLGDRALRGRDGRARVRGRRHGRVDGRHVADRASSSTRASRSSRRRAPKRDRPAGGGDRRLPGFRPDRPTHPARAGRASCGRTRPGAHPWSD